MTTSQPEDGWEEIDLTDSLPVESVGDLSLDELDGEKWPEEGGEDPYSEGTEERSPLSGNQVDLSAPESIPEIPISPQGILEAILFVGTPENRSLQAAEIARLMRGVREDEIHDLVEELNEKYQEEQAAFVISRQGSGYQLVLRDEFESVRNRFYGRVKEAKLSQAAIDVLALVAYRQPATREQIDELRSKPSGGLLNQLVRRQLIAVELEAQSRKKWYRTTDRFLELIGLSDISELPQSEEEEPR